MVTALIVLYSLFGALCIGAAIYAGRPCPEELRFPGWQDDVTEALHAEVLARDDSLQVTP